MSTTIYRGERNDIIARVLRSHETPSGGFRVIRKCWDGWTRLWYLGEVWRRSQEPDEAPVVKRFIGLLLVSSYPATSEWGIKELDDSMGPVDCSAPLAWLDQVTLEQSQTAEDWYVRVRKYHAQKGTGRALKTGMIVPLKVGGTAQITQVKPLRGLYGGHPVRLTRHHIAWDEVPA